MVISQKYITQSEYEKWERKYNYAKTEMNDRDVKIQNVIQELEEGMEFLCITGVEDKLQLDVTDTIELLRHAGIQIWMLTGDKIETATCIAISTGLKSKTQSIFYMRELKTIEEVKCYLEQYETLKDTVLVIDGITLQIALKYQISWYFFKVAGKVYRIN